MQASGQAINVIKDPSLTIPCGSRRIANQEKNGQKEIKCILTISS